MKKPLLISSALLVLLSQTSCVPVAVIGGAGALGYTAAQDRTIGETVDDASIEAQINAQLVASERRKDYTHISEDSVNGRVLLTGSVPSREAKVNAYNIAWQAKGVKEVINELKVDSNAKFSARQYASDVWISTQIESRLLFTKDIRSVNYSVETIDGVVYLMGVAQSKQELDTVTQIASEVSGVQKVVSYVKIKSASSNIIGATNANRNTVPVTEENIGTVPGSVQSKALVKPQQEPEIYNSGDLVIEESPNAE
jgi:osmotically-inducible protein OsmY